MAGIWRTGATIRRDTTVEEPLAGTIPQTRRMAVLERRSASHQIRLCHKIQSILWH